MFDVDRACAEAWKRGGYEEETRERERWRKEERRKIRHSVNGNKNIVYMPVRVYHFYIDFFFLNPWTF